MPDFRENAVEPAVGRKAKLGVIAKNSKAAPSTEKLVPDRFFACGEEQK